MTRKLKFKLLVILVAFAAVSLIAGCKLGYSKEEIIQNENLVSQVTYFANGGYFEDNRDFKDMYYVEGSPFINIMEQTPTKSGTVNVTRENFVFVGWYPAVVDSEGNPLNAAGEVIELETNQSRKGIAEDISSELFPEGNEVLNLNTLRAEKGQHLYFVARWEAKLRLRVVLVGTDNETPEDTSDDFTLKGLPLDDNLIVNNGGEAKEYKNGDIVRAFNFDNSGLVYDPGSDGPVLTAKGVSLGGTFYDYYYDAECTQPVVWPYEMPDGEEEEEGQPELQAEEEEESLDPVIYAKYIEGDWIMLRGAKDIVKNWNSLGNASKKVWLFKDIDCTGNGVLQTVNLACEFRGNGHTISNLKLNQSVSNEGKAGIFKSIKAGAKMTDVNFTNVTVTYSMTGKAAYLYLFAYEILEGATLSNVNVSANVTVTTMPSDAIIDNIQKVSDQWETDNWICGISNSDSDFFTKYNTVSFTDCSLKIKEETIIENYNFGGEN
ncbi:MAG: hypothetical protein J6B04_00570 [Clostridia bacterium]|nr:hypothetical protein [Clostridia bacterium]